MLYTSDSPAQPGDEIRLYFSPEEARAAARSSRQVRGVAVHYDGLLHRLLPLLVADGSWTGPAEFQEDGSIIAHGPIPGSLYLKADVLTACAG